VWLVSDKSLHSTIFERSLPGFQQFDHAVHLNVDRYGMASQHERRGTSRKSCTRRGAVERHKTGRQGLNLAVT
jgi:hypothetical protein